MADGGKGANGMTALAMALLPLPILLPFQSAQFDLQFPIDFRAILN